ncbi:hypothetical protein ACIBF7_28955 [Nonomuraea sp. NPDC050478]|uniref:hypothetical protein n=1 Tax=Nonomuraea sp. NPDC050478 TaxID=3364365 RepID=UPI0037A92A1E
MSENPSEKHGTYQESEAVDLAFGAWVVARQELEEQLIKAAADIHVHLDNLVGHYQGLAADTEYMSSQQQVFDDWCTYLKTLWDEYDKAAKELRKHSAKYTTTQIDEGTRIHQNLADQTSSLSRVLLGLNLFFWNVRNWHDAIKLESAHDKFLAQQSSGPNTTPLSSAWLQPKGLDTVRNRKVGQVIVSHEAQDQSTDVTDDDIKTVRALAKRREK